MDGWGDDWLPALLCCRAATRIASGSFCHSDMLRRRGSHGTWPDGVPPGPANLWVPAAELGLPACPLLHQHRKRRLRARGVTRTLAVTVTARPLVRPRPDSRDTLGPWGSDRPSSSCEHRHLSFGPGRHSSFERVYIFYYSLLHHRGRSGLGVEPRSGAREGCPQRKR